MIINITLPREMPNVADSRRLASSYVDDFTMRFFATPLNFLKVLVLSGCILDIHYS